MAKEFKFTALSECEEQEKTGYFIVDDQLHHVKKGDVIDTWDINGETAADKVASARKVAELPRNAQIYVDDINMFDNDVIADYGKLLTYNEALDELDEEERAGIKDLEDYALNH